MPDLMLDWYWLVIAGLASFRIALMVSKESGPARIFRKLRNIPPPKSATKEGLSCPLCIGVWSSALIVLGLAFKDSQPWIGYVLQWLAISSIAVCLNQQFTKGSL